MELAIGAGIGMLIALITGKRKKRDKRDARQHSNLKVSTEQRRRRQEIDEELITVILPTINNDK